MKTAVYLATGRVYYYKIVTLSVDVRNYTIFQTKYNHSNHAQVSTDMAESNAQNSHDLGNGKSQIFLNAFDMSTVGHLSPGQWKVCCWKSD